MLGPPRLDLSGVSGSILEAVLSQRLLSGAVSVIRLDRDLDRENMESKSRQLQCQVLVAVSDDNPLPVTCVSGRLSYQHHLVTFSAFTLFVPLVRVERTLSAF